MLLVVLSVGAGGTAFADPGDGRGNGVANAATNANGGNSKAGSASSGDATSGSTTATSTNTSAKGPSSGKSSNEKGGSTSTRGSDHSQGNAGTSGDWNKPQPLSNADQNDGGANGKCPGGPYCSTRDGSPSMNGNGGGKAIGKPCAGCVGKADNKNPKGQYPNGSDHNAGYECDRNNGIGKTNPAHTGCQTTPTVVPTCPDGSPVPPGGVQNCVTTPPPPPPTCPDGSPMPPGGIEDCDDAPPPPPPVVGGEDDVVAPPVIAGVETFAPRPRPDAEVLGVQAVAAPAVLPATGSSAGMGLLTGVGFMLLAVGAGLVLRRRIA